MEYRFELIDRRIAFQGFFTLVEYRLRHELFAGGWSDEIVRLCFERGDAVAVLPYDPALDAVVLVEQFRVGALRAASERGPWLYEVIAGMTGPGEAPEQVARREAVEEAGCELLALEPILGYLCSPGGTSERTELYCGRVDARGVGGIHGLAHEHEDIRVHVVPRREALAMLADGRIDSAPAIIALQWLELNHARLLERWGVMAGGNEG